MNASDATREPLPIDLALQGGGSHGAFIWSVLGRLLEEPWLQIAAISGTSAGAMKFLEVHADDLGKRSTADLDVLLTET